MKFVTETKFKRTEVGKIPEDWEVKKIGDCIELIYGKGLPKRQRKKGNIYVFGSNGIVGFHNEAIVKGPGIIIGRKGSVGEIAFSKHDFWPIDTTYYVKTKHGNDMVFWYYFLKTLGLNQMNTHSAIPGLNRDGVYEIIRAIPDLIEQRIIAKTLSDLDAKIELNQQMNRTLESIAQALFKHWFIDFEFPDENGQPYKSSGGKMVDSELGEIPKGWEVAELGTFIDFIKGKKPLNTSEYFIEGYLPQILIENLDGVEPVFSSTEKMIVVNEYEPIMVMDGASSGRIEIGHGGILGSTLSKIVVKKSPLKNSYVYFFLKIQQDDINQNTTGTSIPHTDKERIKRYLFVLPNEKSLDFFDNLWFTIMHKIINNKQEIKTLIRVRDLLLPKLMSGKIRVPLEDANV